MKDTQTILHVSLARSSFTSMLPRLNLANAKSALLLLFVMAVTIPHLNQDTGDQIHLRTASLHVYDTNLVLEET